MGRVLFVSVNCKILLHAVHYSGRNSSGLYSKGGRFNLLKPTGYAMHQQFNIQQL